MIVTCATPNYTDKLSLLLSSCRHTNKDQRLRVYGVGWSPQQLLRGRTAFPAYEFVEVTEPPEVASELKVGGRSGSLLKMKPELLRRAYADFVTEPVIWIDADTMLLRPIAPILQRAAADGSDLAVTCRPQQRPHAKYAVAVLLFTRTDRARALLNAYAEATLTQAGRQGWFHDQLSLLSVVERIHPKITALTETEHSLLSPTKDTIIASRRLAYFDTPAMYAEAGRRGIPVTGM